MGGWSLVKTLGIRFDIVRLVGLLFHQATRQTTGFPFRSEDPQLDNCAPVIPAASAPAAAPRWDQLVRETHVHGSLYTDPAIYQAELEKIWFRTWVYVGHESEIPKPNDYVMKSIGPEPVIMTRDRSGEIHLLHNRCPHRGNRVCMTEQGNARSFT